MSTTPPSTHRTTFATSFFLFGLVNNVLYVVILSAATSLLASSSLPTGVILACNIAPALAVKIGAPYIQGTINYRSRIVFCSILSFVGIVTVASSTGLGFRLLGIALASFSSGLGEMSYLQLSTVYGSLQSAHDLGGIAVGWFASGTGAAGLVGAGLWWILRGLGVRTGLLICAVLPLGMSAVYFGLLPPPGAFATVRLDNYDFVADSDEEDSADEQPTEQTRSSSSLLNRAAPASGGAQIHLSLREKLSLLKPLLVPFCLPLFSVYFAEYTINQGVGPTLVYAVPDRSTSPVLSLLIKSLRDYYPLYQLIYQTFVFISRSSLSILHLPPLPLALLPLPSLIQLGLLAITSLESATGALSSRLGDGPTTWIVFGLISLEGLCGGSAYVNAYYHLGQQMDDEDDHLGPAKDGGKVAQEREFRIASVGVFDTMGILLAAGAASLLEPRLCRAQQDRGKTLCIGL